LHHDYIMITAWLRIVYMYVHVWTYLYCTDRLLYIDCKIKLLQNGTTVLNQRVLQRSEACTKEGFLWTLVFWLFSKIKVRDGIYLLWQVTAQMPHGNKLREVYYVSGWPCTVLVKYPHSVCPQFATRQNSFQSIGSIWSSWLVTLSQVKF